MKDSNRLIAAFMEIEYVNNVYYHESSEYPYEYFELEYNTSWNWLMPVVIKIGGRKNLVGATKILRDYSTMRNLDEVYTSVVAFIREQTKN